MITTSILLTIALIVILCMNQKISKDTQTIKSMTLEIKDLYDKNHKLEHKLWVSRYQYKIVDVQGPQHIDDAVIKVKQLIDKKPDWLRDHIEAFVDDMSVDTKSRLSSCSQHMPGLDNESKLIIVRWFRKYSEYLWNKECEIEEKPVVTINIDTPLRSIKLQISPRMERDSEVCIFDLWFHEIEAVNKL